MNVVDDLRFRKLENMAIPMSDGCLLSADIWLPERAGEENPVPAVLEYIPYRKRDITAIRDSINHAYFAGHGFAGVRVDLRGSGDSQGLLSDEYLEQELSDGETVLRWLAEQPWCSGKIGMFGKSWGGFNGLQLAARQPPELAAVIAVCATDDRYADDIHYMGGCLLGDQLSWSSAMFAHTSCPPDPLVVGDDWKDMWLQRLQHCQPWVFTWLEHQHRDSFWQHGSVCEDFHSIEVPVLAVSGWADGYSNAVFRLLKGLQTPCWGLIGPWGHRYPHQGVPGPAIGFLQEAVRWWGRWLKNEPTGVENEPVLRVWMQDSVPPTVDRGYRPGRWVAESSWPSDRVANVSYTLLPGLIEKSRTLDKVEEEEVWVQSPLSVGLFAGRWCSFTATPDLPHDQREEDGGALVFQSRALEKSMEILGAPEVRLSLSVDQPLAMVAVRLSDVYPDGQAERVTYGLLNLVYRDSFESPSKLTEGRRLEIRCPMNGIAHTFPAGHRVRVSVSTSYWPLAWPSPQPVRLTVFTGASRLLLPVRPPEPQSEIHFEAPSPREPSSISRR